MPLDKNFGILAEDLYSSNLLAAPGQFFGRAGRLSVGLRLPRTRP